MGTEVIIITNNVPRPIIQAYELTEDEREEFDYLDWKAIEKGEDSASFVRYKGEVYDLNEFQFMPNVLTFHGWDGVLSDSFFSGILVKHMPEANFEEVVMGRYYS